MIDQPDPSIRVVTMNRPAKLNACDRDAWSGLAVAFRSLAGDRAVRAAILTGAGGNFCSGDDINAYAAVRGDEAASTAYRQAIRDAHTAIENAEVPVIAAINGVCVGGGCSLALCCDFRIANANARAGIPAARLGLAFSLEHCQRLAAAVGLAHARRILYAGEIFDAGRAEAMGLFDRVVEGDAMREAMAIAASMAANAPLSVAAFKASLAAIALNHTEARRSAIAAACRRADTSRDAAEGARAFAEKRKPRFTGE
ncbi:MAG: enoyl-CoA hydratase/isomerase family protein [Alphaproteobacteria bacterium]|nr:enoyl-CoA hydratase/isomerase family protein [Alphaproteobacteria bacterium]